MWYISRKGNRKVLRVGQAKVLRERLAADRSDEEIKDCATRHTLYVTWRTSATTSPIFRTWPADLR
jgi:hypothetical protein